MNIKKIISKVTGYWLHKRETLPIGADLFHDINIRLKHGELKTVFDVGANEGQTLKWVKHHQPAAMIHSFEPAKSSFLKLKEIAEKKQGCAVIHSALGSEKGIMEIKLFKDYSILNSLKPNLMNQDFDAQTETIKINRLDAYCHSQQIHKIDLLKIDTKGYELEVLKGADKMLSGKISFIYSEVGFQSENNRNTLLGELIDFLEPKDYLFYALYQLDPHDWKNKNHLGNALFVHKNVYPF